MPTKADILSALEALPDDDTDLDLHLVVAARGSARARVAEKLTKISDDEPLFLVRAQDASAEFLVRYWAQMNVGFGASPEKRESAVQIANDFRAFPADRKKVAD